MKPSQHNPRTALVICVCCPVAYPHFMVPSWKCAYARKCYGQLTTSRPLTFWYQITQLGDRGTKVWSTCARLFCSIARPGIEPATTPSILRFLPHLVSGMNFLKNYANLSIMSPYHCHHIFLSPVHHHHHHHHHFHYASLHLCSTPDSKLNLFHISFPP